VTAPLLSISKLHKSYAVPVLRGVEFQLFAGEVHALVGANGAGKTTLCNVICGLTPFDSGDMLVRGKRHRPSSVRDSEDAGISIVMQELNLIDNLSIGENLFFSDLPGRRGFIDFEQLYDESQDVLRSIGLANLDPRQLVHTLGVGQQQLVEIARVLIRPCSILILDEPTAALTDPQIEILFEKLDQLKSQGVGIIYISHRMNEIGRIADRITVLRDGRSVSTTAMKSQTKDEIVQMMVGGMLSRDFVRTGSSTKSIALKVRGLSTKQLLRDIDLDIYRGEILGIAGLIGSGRTELLRAIFGADASVAGYLQLGENQNRPVFKSPEEAVRNNIGLIPEDRKQQGLLLSQSITSNVTLSSLHKFRQVMGWINRKQEHDEVEEYRQTLDIQCTGNTQTVRELSGGNQQKISIAKWLMKDCSVLLFDEPTRGIDIQTKEAIYELLNQLASQGKAIIIVSSESDELTTICDRIAVLSNGYLADIFGRDEWTAEKIMAASFSAYTNDDAA
jgi:ribose transport system ATP-binding protein